ncbi:hypothetical protein NMG60_11004435 [Bertholletia excelsa]
MQSSSLLSLSPSFNSYSSGKLAEIAARVVEEFRRESNSEFDDVFGFASEEKPDDEHKEAKDSEEEDDEDFEFPFLSREPATAISADDIFFNGQIRPIYPVFNRDLLFSGVDCGNDKVNFDFGSSKPAAPSSIRLPLSKLFSEDRDPPSCSSSEADELDGVAAGTYCVWTPKTTSAATETPGRCKKSNSTGSSKRWKFRDLLRRSNSDGKDAFVFLAPHHGNAKKKDDDSTSEIKSAGTGKSKIADGAEFRPVSSAKNRTPAKEGDKRRSYLPYRQDLVGLFANVNGLSRNLHPF